jgi:predicted DNA-binding transcriptional regulator AlpA
MTDDKVSDALKEAYSVPRKQTTLEVLTQEYAEGADDDEVMAAINMSRTEFYQTYESEPIFKQFVDIGRQKSVAWWKSQARKNLFKRGMNTAAWMFVMKNRFGWAEKTEVTSDIPRAQKSDDELRQEIKARLPEMAKRLGLKKDSDLLKLPEPENDV